MTELTAWNGSTGHAYYDRLWQALLHAPVLAPELALLHALVLMPGLALMHALALMPGLKLAYN
ncbi:MULTISPECIES: hypothetical protein [unclassified Anaerobiospirillum]|uniref:hypothetical protein n=1 Tax=unclassified Anaerobiospirillum TaxID=2647410 RepID=UPI001FF594BC|nr:MULTISPECIES: hypothetical protein [unclassified Anaerobiospirillum]MCK0533731.1 hypothetical protein [Anaerobiospirillum sp. NML120511]MCK0540028.1 hypothetical protein [Anaerobiospirillum sp. NML02-A-032]